MRGSSGRKRLKKNSEAEEGAQDPNLKEEEGLLVCGGCAGANSNSDTRWQQRARAELALRETGGGRTPST